MSDPAPLPVAEMIGESCRFHALRTLLTRIARCNASVLVQGETGTGKEVAARSIHYGGVRATGPFVPINCGAIPDSLFESELFGHAQGAFTDAKKGSFGIVGLAEGGTLFLDEVDSLSEKAQVALLRFLQDRQFRRVGEGLQRRADVRVIAASNRELDQLVLGGRFRMDLFYRLNVMLVQIPPLRERGADVVMLARHFVLAHSQRHGLRPLPMDRESEAWLCAQPWPGNIRQLENLMEREVLLAEGQEVLRLTASASTSERPSAGTEAYAAESWDYRRAKARILEEFNRDFLSRLMEFTQGNVSLAARTCGKERRELGRLLRRYSIHELRTE